MNKKKHNIVTGALSYSGKYITKILLEKNEKVRTFTGHPQRRDPFEGKIDIRPYSFDDPKRMVKDLEGIDVVYNTYWVRFNHGSTTYGQAVANTQNMIWAAQEAGVSRFVHVSISNPSLDSRLPYFRGKAILERTLERSGLSYAIVRPTVLFGKEDILINNIAYLLRRLPLFGIFGRGDYRLQPVYVEDLARLMVELGESRDNVTVDAVGPEVYAYADMVRLIQRAVGSGARLVPLPRYAALPFAWIAGAMVGDKIITKDEIDGLMDDLLVSERPPLCPTRLSDWIKANRLELGTKYASELARHFR